MPSTVDEDSLRNQLQEYYEKQIAEVLKSFKVI